MKFDELAEIVKEPVYSESDKLVEMFSWNDAVKASTYNGSTEYNHNALTKMVDMDAWQRASLDRAAMLNTAHNTLPFPLDRLPEQLATAYMDMVKCKETLLKAYQQGIMNTEEKNVLKKEIAHISAIQKEIQKITYSFDNWTT